MNDLCAKSENNKTHLYETSSLMEHDEVSASYSSTSEDVSNDSDVSGGLLNHSSSNRVLDQKSQGLLLPLFPEKVRWFYKEGKLWIPFCGYDSLRLETKHRELMQHNKLSKESTEEKIVVRGDLFEVDVLKRQGFPIYWHAMDDNEESFKILRGTWFRETSWLPLDSEKISDAIDDEHMKMFGSDSALANSEQSDGFAQQLSQKLHLNIKSLSIDGYHVDWYDQNNTYIYADSASHFIRHRIGLTKVGTKISRGYKTDARIDDKLPDITHLVFVIHGIGQKMKGGDIAMQVSRVRSVCRRVTKKYFPLLESANQRVEFLPVEWRKSLVLDGDTVDLITPNRNKGLRSVVNTTALDILYYSSPIYRPEMIGSLRSELNRLYSMFCSRSPYFETKGGKVSVLSHSLGTVLLYDILTNWSPAKVYEYLETLDVDNKDKTKHDQQMHLFSELNSAKEKVRHLELLVLTKAEQQNAKRGQTNFRVANFPSNFIDGNLWKVLPKLENLFCVGSPLSVFLALRGLKPQNTSTIDHILPSTLCRRFFNIFHPADPVVYRMEPLINKSYANIEPVRIYRVDNPNKYSYDNIHPNQIYDIEYTNSFDSPTKQSIQDELSSRSASEAHSGHVSRSKNTLAGRLMKFFHKWKSTDSTGVLADAVVNQVVPGNNIKLLDDDSDCRTPNIVPRKKKIKRKTTTQDTQGNNQFVDFRAIQQAHLTKSSKYISTRKSSNHRKNLRRLSEFQLQKDIELYFNSCNSDKSSRRKTLTPSIDSSDNETLKSDSDSLPTEAPAIEEEITSTLTDSVDSELKFRIDYKLPESRYESSYLSVLTSHTCYWNSPELCMFMLTHIFQHLGPIGKPL